MKMYKIIPAEHRVEELTYNGTYEQMRGRIPYEWFDHAKMNKAGDRVFVNDTGLLDGTEEKEGSFYWLHDNGQYQQFVGQALYWGTCNENTADPFLTIDQVRARIAWKQPAGAKQADSEITIKEFGSLEDLLNSMEW